MHSRGYGGRIELIDSDEGFGVYAVFGERQFLGTIRIVVKPLRVGEEYLLRSPVDYTRILRSLDQIFSQPSRPS